MSDRPAIYHPFRSIARRIFEATACVVVSWSLRLSSLFARSRSLSHCWPFASIHVARLAICSDRMRACFRPLASWSKNSVSVTRGYGCSPPKSLYPARFVRCRCVHSVGCQVLSWWFRVTCGFVSSFAARFLQHLQHQQQLDVWFRVVFCSSSFAAFAASAAA